jgi:hypothetical protein
MKMAYLRGRSIHFGLQNRARGIQQIKRESIQELIEYLMVLHFPGIFFYTRFYWLYW